MFNARKYMKLLLDDPDVKEIIKELNEEKKLKSTPEPVSNPMIEGEDEMLIDMYERGYHDASKNLPSCPQPNMEIVIWKREKTMMQLRDILIDQLTKCREENEALKQSSQPIVKGEGKWTDEDMRNAWNADMKHDPNGRRFDEWLANYKPTPSPEKQEEGKHQNIIKEDNSWLDTLPKPDGMQGEKEMEEIDAERNRMIEQEDLYYDEDELLDLKEQYRQTIINEERDAIEKYAQNSYPKSKHDQRVFKSGIRCYIGNIEAKRKATQPKAPDITEGEKNV